MTQDEIKLVMKWCLPLGTTPKKLDELVETFAKEHKEAINYSQYCKSDREQLRDKKIKDLVNIANSELSNYNKQKILKTETEESRNRNKLLKKIVDLQNP